MNGMKFNAALIFAIVLQAVALVWYVSKIDSRVNILYEKYEVDSDAEVVENQVRMKLAIETLIEDVEAIQKELSKSPEEDTAKKNFKENITVDEAASLAIAAINLKSEEKAGIEHIKMSKILSETKVLEKISPQDLKKFDEAAKGKFVK